MMTDLNWTEFCELYYETAKKAAEVHLHSLLARKGQPNKHVDLGYVVDAAVLAALEKTYTHFDASRGAKISTYLSRIVHNAVVDEYVRESKAAAQQDDIEDLKIGIRAYSDDLSPEAKEKLIARMRTAIAKLSPSDQVILSFWLEDKSTYVARSAEALGTTESYIAVRRHRIFNALPRLMSMTREDYLLYENNDMLIFSRNIELHIESADVYPTEISRTLRQNPIMSVDVGGMAEKIVGLCLK